MRVETRKVAPIPERDLVKSMERRRMRKRQRFSKRCDLFSMEYISGMGVRATRKADNQLGWPSVEKTRF